MEIVSSIASLRAKQFVSQFIFVVLVFEGNFDLTINGNHLKRDFCIKYLGVLIDSNLSWKPQVDSVVKNIKRSIGILSKLQYYVNITIQINLYYSLIYPFLTYGILSWGNAYTTTLQPLYILQKKAMRIITFSNFDQHSTPLFRLLNIIKLDDLVTLHISIFMFKFHNRLLPSYFDFFFTEVKEIHKYNTRGAANQSYYMPRARTNYGLFNINSISRTKSVESIWKTFVHVP